jgi:hypothetical protein
MIEDCGAKVGLRLLSSRAQSMIESSDPKAGAIAGLGPPLTSSFITYIIDYLKLRCKGRSRPTPYTFIHHVHNK